MRHGDLNDRCKDWDWSILKLHLVSFSRRDLMQTELTTACGSTLLKTVLKLSVWSVICSWCKTRKVQAVVAALWAYPTAHRCLKFTSPWHLLNAEFIPGAGGEWRGSLVKPLRPISARHQMCRMGSICMKSQACSSPEDLCWSKLSNTLDIQGGDIFRYIYLKQAGWEEDLWMVPVSVLWMVDLLYPEIRDWQGNVPAFSVSFRVPEYSSQLSYRLAVRKECTGRLSP